MYAQVALIIDSRKEMSQKYKKLIQQDSYVQAIISHETDDGMNKIKEHEPDLIILCDNHQENINDLCKKVRQISDFYRPVVVVLSKSSYLDDKLNALKAGADDYLSEPIEPEEFSIRMFAHLRRHIEELSNPITKLPSYSMAYKVLNRAINSDEKWAILYSDIDNIKPYAEIYGYLASEKILKTCAAILKSAINKGDFIGHIKDDSFIILTSPARAEMVAIFINHAFDTVSSKFYNEQDVNRGYLIVNGDQKAGVRVPFVSLSVGIVSNLYKNYKNYQEVINSLLNTHKLAKSQFGSSFISEAPQICGNDCIININRNKILIAESDEALSYLLETTLKMQGFESETISREETILASIERIKPDLVLLDAKEEKHSEILKTCHDIKANNKQVKIIVSTEIHNKEAVLDTGADLYLPKPYELMTLFKWIEYLLNSEC